MKRFWILLLVVGFVHFLFFSCVLGKRERGQKSEEKQESSGASSLEKAVGPIPTPELGGGVSEIPVPLVPGGQPVPVIAQPAGSILSAHYDEGTFIEDLKQMPKALEDATAICKAGVCIDLSTNRILWQKNAMVGMPIASMTKMMTVYLCMKRLREQGSSWSLQTVIPATREACKIGGHQIFMDPSESFTLDELLKCIMIRSANDCAYLLGQSLAGGDMGAFVKAMNQESQALGYKKFRFLNAHGLHEFLSDGKTRQENMGCAMELAHLAGMLMDCPEVMKWAGTKHDCIRENSTKFKPFDLDSTNSLLNNPSCPGVNGMKTGMTNGAGHCVTTTCERGGRRMVVVVMGCPSWKERDALVRQVLNWGYSN